ncbi:MAG TPA: guanine deaminase [Solirubrobacteraceae bacterium]|nr:guanine deaminase [Solirubrobacteraceae bacterium]
MTTIVRAKVAHTPGNPFAGDGALQVFDDGALAFAGGRIVACGAYGDVRAGHPDAEVLDARDTILLPGFVDCHVHYPQIAVIGSMGLELMDWLESRCLPEEARLADLGYARSVAERFVRGLAANGTTTALVFGSHFAGAQEALFAAAAASGLRVASGLVVSDRGLLPELHVSASVALEASRELCERWHGRGLIRYAVTPRFSVSCSDEMLGACGELLGSADDLLFTTHLNESLGEIDLVASLFPGARDYLETYERHGLVGARSVFAHDVHVSNDELRRLAGADAAVAHCPSSNAFLGSGLFPLRRHLDAGVRVGLGTDVGAGTGLSLLKEGLAAHDVQMLQGAEGVRLSPARLLWLATAAGAAALGLSDEIGDLSVGKSADYVLVRPPAGSTLEVVVQGSDSLAEALGAVFALAREESIAEVRVAGRVVSP